MRLAAGAFLATAGDHGLRVYAWDDVLHARDQMPGPRVQAEAELVEDEWVTAPPPSSSGPPGCKKKRRKRAK